MNRKVRYYKIKLKRLSAKLAVAAACLLGLAGIGYVGFQTWPGYEPLLIVQRDYSCEIKSCSYKVKVRNLSGVKVSGFLRVNAYVTPQEPYLTGTSRVKKRIIASKRQEFEIGGSTDSFISGEVEGQIQPDRLLFSVGVVSNENT